MSPAQAGELTDVIDAGDEDDPFDFTGEIIYGRALRRAKITREFHCDVNDQANRITGCPEAGPEGAIVNAKELRYERITHTLTPRFRFGLWHDLEFSITAPIVLTDTQSLRLAGDGGDANGIAVTPETSSILDDENGNLFPVPMSSEDEGLMPTRAGFGDMLFQLRWSPISQSRDEQRGNWTLEVGYRAPTGQTMEFGNEGVGRGMHELIFGTGLSRRYKYIDPYMHFDFVLPLVGNHPLFKDYGGTQEVTGPGYNTGFDLGMEIVPYDNKERQVKFFIDLGFGARYQAEGRDYHELFDALAIGSNAPGCTDAQGNRGSNCATFTDESNSELAGQPHNGVTVVEDYMTFVARLALGLQASAYLRLKAEVALAHNTEHFLSKADAGQDLDGVDGVQRTEEWNPIFAPAIDQIGRRLRIEETTIFSSSFSAAIMF